MNESEIVDVMRDICGIGSTEKELAYKQVQSAIGEILKEISPQRHLPPVSEAVVCVFSAAAVGLLEGHMLDFIDPSTVISTEDRITFTYITEPDNVPVQVTISAKEV